MINWLKEHGVQTLGVTLFGVATFIAGQITPSFFDFAAGERATISSLIEKVETTGNALEATIPEIMEVAIADGKVSEPVNAMNGRLLELFQVLDSVQDEFPEVSPEREKYVSTLIRLREVSSTVTGPLDAPAFIEAASQFKDARLNYEERVSSLEPTFLGSIVQSFR